MTFSREVWDEIAPIYAAILKHPFLRELGEGTLARERFVFYMKQDALYLQDFSRALALAAVRSPSVPDMQTFLGFAHGVAVVESALHETYFKEFGVTLDVEKAPANFAYANFLLATCSIASNAESMAALLPCFWIYREVGAHIVDLASSRIEANPYARWIETYSGEDFNESVERAIAIVDTVAESCTKAERERMHKAFVLSSRLEWMFWDSAYRQEAWPPSLE